MDVNGTFGIFLPLVLVICVAKNKKYLSLFNLQGAELHFSRSQRLGMKEKVSGDSSARGGLYSISTIELGASTRRGSTQFSHGKGAG